MTAQPYRFSDPLAQEPVLHELPPLNVADRRITLQLSVRRDDYGDLRARLLFLEPGHSTRETAEIFCAATETELWQAVRRLNEHHLRALFLSLA